MSKAPETIYITVVLEYNSTPPRIGLNTKDFGDFTVHSLQFNDALRELESLHSALRHLSRNASVMTSHQIETMARDALEKS